MNANAAGEGRPFLPEPCTRTYGDMNAGFWLKHQATPLDGARGLLAESHSAVMVLAEGFSDEELFHKGRFDWTGRTTLGSYLRERHELPLRLGAQDTARPQEELRTARVAEPGAGEQRGTSMESVGALLLPVARWSGGLAGQWPGGLAAWWSETRLSLGRIRGLSGCVVQNASESARIRPDPAKTV